MAGLIVFQALARGVHRVRLGVGGPYVRRLT